MLEFLIDNIFVSFGGTLFQQVVGIPMGTHCAPLLADLFLNSYESEFRSEFLICHGVEWYIELKNQKFSWRIPERKILISGYPKDL
jgi:hypothetical protein